MSHAPKVVARVPWWKGRQRKEESFMHATGIRNAVLLCGMSRTTISALYAIPLSLALKTGKERNLFWSAEKKDAILQDLWGVESEIRSVLARGMVSSQKVWRKGWGIS